MKRAMPDDLEKSCSLCEHSRFIFSDGNTVCTKGKSLKTVSPDYCCSKFRFDILAYRPMPLKIPKFLDDGSKL